MKVLVSVKYFLIFYIVKLSKIVRNRSQMKNVYQIDQNGQNEPKLTKVVGTQVAKMDQNDHS